MKIVIDGRFWGLENTGLGRYTMGLVNSLCRIDEKNNYYLLLRAKYFEQFDKLNLTDRWHPILAEAKHYSFKEQITIPLLLRSIKPDLFHCLHFNFPILYQGKSVVTIHDLITQYSVGTQASTLSKHKYWLKWYAHNFVLQKAIRQAEFICAPSLHTKKMIIEKYNIDKNKVKVTYEGVEETYKSNVKLDKSIVKSLKLDDEYFVYTGNVYPHKNVDLLIEALAIFNKNNKKNYRLIIVGSRSVFEPRIKELANKYGVDNNIVFTGYLDDEQIKVIYNLSKAFVMPSKLEGFGLPALEAMASGAIVLSSNASCLPEIYEKAAWYFDPNQVNQLVSLMEKVDKLNPKQLQEMIGAGKQQVSKYSWDNLAKQTLEIYNQALSVK